MRAQPILRDVLASRIPVLKATHFASTVTYRGGWEGWLQGEIAHAFYSVANNVEIDREYHYRSGLGPGGNQYLSYNGGTGVAATAAGPAARCDFRIYRPAGGGREADETYIELKCLSPTTGLDDAWTRFRADVTKISALQQVNRNLVCIAILGTYGFFNLNRVKGEAPTLAWCWSGGKSAYALDYDDPDRPRVTTLQNVSTGGNERLFLVAISV